MRDYLNISPTPVGEDCQQVPYSYPQLARKECEIFRDQLIREFGEPPFGASVTVKSFPHEFGNYYDVVCYFEDENEEAVNYAFKLEGNTPENWDEQSLRELAEYKAKLGL